MLEQVQEQVVVWDSIIYGIRVGDLSGYVPSLPQ